MEQGWSPWIPYGIHTENSGECKDLAKGLALAVLMGWVVFLVATGVFCLPPMAMVCIALLALDTGDRGTVGGS